MYLLVRINCGHTFGEDRRNRFNAQEVDMEEHMVQQVLLKAVPEALF